MQEDALPTQLVLQLRPSLGHRSGVSTLHRGSDLHRTLTATQLDPDFASRLGPQDSRHRSVPEALEQHGLSGEEFLETLGRSAGPGSLRCWCGRLRFRRADRLEQTG